MGKFKIICMVVSVLISGSTFANTFVSCKKSNFGIQSMDAGTARIIKQGAVLFDLNVLVADTAYERAYGFQYVCPNIIHNNIILFVFSEPVIRSFHMSNVKAPLDIGFFDGDGVLLDIQKMPVYEAEERILYTSDHAFQFALEAGKGFYDKHNITLGSILEIVQ